MSFGRLERTPAAPPMSDINMTPLIDVMLVLLVIFIITAPLLVGAVKVDLPAAQARQALDGPAFVAITIDRQGQVFLNEAPISADALAEALQRTAQNNAQTEVRLRADQSVPYGRVVEVMGLAQQAGLTRMGFVADAPPGKSAAVH